MKSLYRLFMIVIPLSAVDCAHVDTHTSSSIRADSHSSQITKASLQGVWEVVSCSASYHSPGDVKSMTNSKYCFNNEMAYPGLAPDSASDSADGGGDYYIVGGDILVIRTGVPGGIEAYGIEIINDELILYDRNLRMTLRRIAKVWSDKAPIIRHKEIPIR